jgi:hypothetical protein
MADNTSSTAPLDLIAKLVGLAASASLALSVIFDWGFYSALNLSFLEVPSGLSDHVRSALIWFPKVVAAFGGLFVFEMLTMRIEQGMTEEEIVQSSSNPQRTKRLRDAPYKMGVYIAVFVVIAYVLLGDIFLGTLPFGLIVSWFVFSAWAQSHPRIIERRPLHFRVAAYFLPPTAIWLFFSGYGDAVRMFHNTTPDLKLTVANTTSSEPVTLLRQLDRGLLVKEANNTISFRPWSEIKKVETSGRYVPSKGVLCSWFGVACVHIEQATDSPQETKSNPPLQGDAPQAARP